MAKNLLVVSNSFPDEEDTFIGNIFVKEQIKYLKGHFDNVFVISPVAYGMQRLRGAVHRDYEYDNVRVFFPKYINNPVFWYYGKTLWAELEARAIMATIKREDLHIDLIHAHFTWPSGAAAIRLKEAIGVPVVITEHTHQTLYKAVRRRDRSFIDAWARCDAIIRVNKRDVPLISGLGVDPSKIYSIANGYDPVRYHPQDMESSRRSLGLPTKGRVVLNIGRLAEEKGQRHLVSAINEIVKVRDDVVCYIGGTGPLRGDLEHQIAAMGLQEHVRLAGFIPAEQMGDWMNAADLFVLPSLGEGNPTVMFECLGCGTPFVGTRVGGVPEVITSADYGRLVEPDDPRDLTRNILAALDQRWDRAVIHRYASRYQWGSIAREIMAVYDRVLVPP